MGFASIFGGKAKIGSLVLGDGMTLRHKRIAITSGPTGAEQDSGFDLPKKGLVLKVWIDVKTAEATGVTKTLDVGLKAGEAGGDADGFLDGVSVSATGLKIGTVTITDGANQNYISARTLGVLLADVVDGADVAGQAGVVNGKMHVLNGTARSVVYTSGSAFTEFRGDIHLLYVDAD